RELTPDPPVEKPVAPEVDDATRHRARCARYVDRARLDVALEHDHCPAGPHNSHHLRERALRLGEVEEDALGPAAVERRVGLGELVHVRTAKVQWQAQALCSSYSLG